MLTVLLLLLGCNIVPGNVYACLHTLELVAISRCCITRAITSCYCILQTNSGIELVVNALEFFTVFPRLQFEGIPS